jgi:predicted metal-binding membrane protein
VCCPLLVSRLLAIERFRMSTELPAPSRQHPYMRLGWPWLIVGAAWTTTIIATLSGWRIVIDHHYLLEESGLPWAVAAVVFLVGWQVMLVAMMAPSGVLIMPGIPADWGKHHYSSRRFALFFAGYASVWTVFGLLAFAGDTLIHRLVDSWPWLAAHSFVIGAVTFTVAGLFQFTPWKAVCLARCQSLHDSGKAIAGARLAWQEGIRYGAISVGCCWALMLVMFGIGMGNLGWMVALTVMMTSESAVPNVRHSRNIRLAVGVVLLLLAGLWLAHPVWLVPVAAS